MVEFLVKLLLVARSKLKSRARIEAENTVLRQQMIVLSRKAHDIFEGTQQINMIIASRRILGYSSKVLNRERLSN